MPAYHFSIGIDFTSSLLLLLLFVQKEKSSTKNKE